MATAREYFERSQGYQAGCDIVAASSNGESCTMNVQVVYDFDALSKYLKIYIPEADAPEALLASVIQSADELIWRPEADIHWRHGWVFSDEKISRADLRFTGRVLVYTPTVTSESQWAPLAKKMSQNGLVLLVRDGKFVDERNRAEAPLAFISHDSRDKEPFVRELAAKLSTMLCPVWYDEYELQAGDSLRESIESGLKTCPKCIVVLSKNFFSNPGWTKREFDMIYTREILEGRRIMIPVWLDVERQDVFDYSPVLLDKVGIHAHLGVQTVAEKLMLKLKIDQSAS